MDFYSILQVCYKKGITPFALYSTMLDFCKGDLALKEQVGVLYQIYKQSDIFDEIALCKEGKKVRFSWKNLMNYGVIQLELWLNMIRRLI